MNCSLNYQKKILLSVIILFIIASCAGTEPSRYYLLSPLPGTSVPQQTSAPCVSLIIGPVRLPEYTNRPQIVTRSSQNELNRAQFDLWAEPVSDTFPRIMAENLTHLICTKNVSLFLWNSSAPADYRVIIEVIRMDGTLGKEAVLEAWWSVSSGKESKMLVSKQSRLTEPVKNQSYEAFVQAHSAALESLSREIAQVINNLVKEGPPK
jgi:uncharacterized lipoprotein YmbA